MTNCLFQRFLQSLLLFFSSTCQKNLNKKINLNLGVGVLPARLSSCKTMIFFSNSAARCNNAMTVADSYASKNECDELLNKCKVCVRAYAYSMVHDTTIWIMDDGW